MELQENLNEWIKTARARMQRHFFIIFSIFFVFAILMPSSEFSWYKEFFDLMENFTVSAKKMGEATGGRNDIRFYFSMVLIFSFFWAAWYFIFLKNKINYFLFDVKSEGGLSILWVKSLFSLILLLIFLWYVYFLPGGINFANPGKGIFLIGVAVEYNFFLGVLGGFLVVGLFVAWFSVGIRCFYLFKILVSKE